MINVIRPGSFTTIQDLGRWGYQAWGIPVSGAMDPYACRMANLMAGNPEDAAVLEMSEEGGMFHFDESAFAAIGGADMQAEMDGRRLEPWSSFILPAGSVLRFGRAARGRRAYLAVQGGLVSEPVMGSRSTYTAAAIGGFEGRALLIGDSLEIGNAQRLQRQPFELPAELQPAYGKIWDFSVLLGPQAEYFCAAEQHRFFSSRYVVSDMAGRMDYELEGEAIHVSAHEVVSDASGWGAVEISEGGHPFIVTPDHGTTRGFTKIGYIIQDDFYKIAQASPGDQVQFSEVSLDDAVRRLQDMQRRMEALKEKLRCSSL